MATTFTDLLTWKAFEQIPDDCMHREILEGELVVLPPAKLRHSGIASRIGKMLRPVEEKLAGVVLFEAGYKLSEFPPSWIQPDVSVITTERFHRTNPDGYSHGGPELAIEIISPSDTARDMNRKIDLLLGSGTMAVWVIYPDEKEVRVFLPDGTSSLKDLNAVIHVPVSFGPLEIPVSAFFYAL